MVFIIFSTQSRYRAESNIYIVSFIAIFGKKKKQTKTIYSTYLHTSMNINLNLSYCATYPRYTYAIVLIFGYNIDIIPCNIPYIYTYSVIHLTKMSRKEGLSKQTRMSSRVKKNLNKFPNISLVYKYSYLNLEIYCITHTHFTCIDFLCKYYFCLYKIYQSYNVLNKKKIGD